MVLNIRGSYKIEPWIALVTRPSFPRFLPEEYHPNGPDGAPVTIDFTPPWPRISMVEEIEKKGGVTLGRNFDDPATLKKLDDLAPSLPKND